MAGCEWDRLVERDMGMFGRRQARRDERGAEAVEFALVTIVLFPLLFGIIQYGICFNDFLQSRQAVRQGARTAVVLLTPACSGNAANSVLAITCNATAGARPVSGSVASYVKAPGGWAVGQPLVVCQTVKVADVTGMLPLPNNGFVMTKTQMSIEQDTPAPTGTFPAGDSDPTGNNWSWCS
jgi:hypothetical protein